VLNLDFGPITTLTYVVKDERGHEVEPEPGGFRSSFIIPGYHLFLPPDSLLRFPVSVNGGGVFADRTKLDNSPRRGIWYFDRATNRELSLSGTLRVPGNREHWGPQWWRGELQIPPVKLVIPGPSAQRAGVADSAQPSGSETNQAPSAASSYR
jgi:hypothetical protein